MAWAALLKSAGSKAAMQSGKKMATKVAKEAAVNKVKSVVKKKKVSGKDVAKKMLGGGGESSGGGGALAIRPSTSIVSSPAGGLVPSTKVDEGGALVVKSKGADDLGLTSFMESLIGVKESVKSIKDSLNDNSEDAEKRLEKQRLLNAQLEKEEQEEALEGKKPGIGKKLLSPIQKMGESFLEKLKRFFKAVLLGVLINGLIGGQRDVVVAFIAGYKAYRMAKDAAIKFIFKIGSKIKGGIKGAAGKLANSGKSIFQTLVNVGKALVRWVKGAIQVVIKGASEVAKRTPQALRTGKRILQKVKPIQRLQGGIKTLNKFRKNPLQTLKSITNSGIGQRISGTFGKGKNLLSNIGSKGPGIFGKLKNWGGAAVKGVRRGAKVVAKGAVAVVKGAAQILDDIGKGFMKGVNKVVSGVKGMAKKWAKKIGDIVELAKNPAKLAAKVKSTLKGVMDKLLKKNKIVKQVMELGKDPKKIGKLIKNLGKNKNVLKTQSVLQKGMKLKIGGLDAVLAALMGFLDYVAFGESPINAVLRAAGSLVGYTAGFAIGAPFGGVPGFITGMAGGWVGEKAADVIAAGLSKTKLGSTPDPLQGDGRMIVRDPFSGQGEGERMDNIQDAKLGNNKTEDISQDISSSASYEDGADDTTVVINGGEGEQAPAPTSQSRKVEYLPLGTGDSGEVLNTLTNATLYKT